MIKKAIFINHFASTCDIMTVKNTVLLIFINILSGINRGYMNRTHLLRVLDYIELHLKEERQGVLDNKTLAGIAGYSEYHFLRIFRKYVKLTPADYIRKRRISEIIRRICEVDGPIADIAFEYGFNSKENFTRAFKQEHHILPTEFRRTNCSLRLFEPFCFDSPEPSPEVSIVYLNGFALTAYPFEEEIPSNCWNRYYTENGSFRLSGRYGSEDFGAMIWNSEKGRLDYYIGVRSGDAVGDTSGTVELFIESGIYAVFQTEQVSQHEFAGMIRRTWDWIYQQWFSDSGYRRGNGFELESYIESSKKYSERIYIPVRKE